MVAENQMLPVDGFTLLSTEAHVKQQGTGLWVPFRALMLAHPQRNPIATRVRTNPKNLLPRQKNHQNNQFHCGSVVKSAAPIRSIRGRCTYGSVVIAADLIGKPVSNICS